MQGKRKDVQVAPLAWPSTLVYNDVLGYHRTLSKHASKGAPPQTIVHVPSGLSIALADTPAKAKKAITQMLEWPIDWHTIHLAEEGQGDKVRLKQDLDELVEQGEIVLPSDQMGYKKTRGEE